MTWTVTATPQPANVPPRIQVTVTTTDSTPNVTVLRNNPDGSQSRLRTTTADVLQLPGGTGIVFDYEAPLGQSATYTVMGQSATSAAVSVTDTRVWLMSPGTPALSMQIRVARDSFMSVDNDVSQGVFEVLGRESPVIVTDGQRKSDAAQVVAYTANAAELTSLLNLLAPAQALLLNVPTGLGYGVSTDYIQPGKVTVNRVSPMLADPARTVVIPYRVVSQPVGGAIQQKSYLDVLANYASYSALAAAPAYSSLL